jgi:hypothetical protein
MSGNLNFDHDDTITRRSGLAHFFKMERIWNYEIVNDDIIFTQKVDNKEMELKVPIIVFNNDCVDFQDNIDCVCGGCLDLPIEGYDNKKHDWCQLSRHIANLYPRYKFLPKSEDLDQFNINYKAICEKLKSLGNQYEILMYNDLINFAKLNQMTKSLICESAKKHSDVMEVTIDIMELWFPGLVKVCDGRTMWNDIDLEIQSILISGDYPDDPDDDDDDDD